MSGWLSEPKHNYQAAWFALLFLRNPAVCLQRLPERDFVLVERELAVGASADRKITSLLRRLDEALISEDAVRLGYALQPGELQAIACHEVPSE